MKWQEIRQQYPDQWLLIEATEAHSAAGQRILEQMSVIGTFSDSVTAMQSYTHLHHSPTEREFYVFHTGHEKLDIPEREGRRRLDNL